MAFIDHGHKTSVETVDELTAPLGGSQQSLVIL